MAGMACFERTSPALKEILLKLYSAERPMELDHHLHEFGSVDYYIQSSASDPHHAYLSISTPLLSQGILLSQGLPCYTVDMIKGICSDAVEIVEPAREGYQLTLRLDFTKIPHRKDSIKMITNISTVQALILSSQLKEMLRNVNSQDISQGMYKPIKFVYHPREPFFVIKQPAKITAVFPIRLKDNSDVIIATAFFQELMDVGSSKAWEKAPLCTWSPIPPPELRGETFEDLSTNGGQKTGQDCMEPTEFLCLRKISCEEHQRFYPEEYEKAFGKFGRGNKIKPSHRTVNTVLQNASIEEDQYIKKVQGCRDVTKLVSFSKPRILKRRWDFTSKIKRIRSRIKIHGFSYFRRRWLKIPKFSSVTRYTKLDKQD